MELGKLEKDLLISLVVVMTLVFVCLGVFSNLAFADDVVDQIFVVVPQSCSVEGIVVTGGDHTKTMQNNQHESEIGTTTFKTYCNDNGGYAIYAIGFSNDELGNTLMKHNASSTYDFDTGTATSGNTSNWAMKLSPISGTFAPTIHSDTNGAFSSYHIVPNEYTKVVTFASNTDLPAEGVNATGSGFTSTYAAWISATQVAGTYTGKVKYTLVHPTTEIPPQPVACAGGKICYNPNSNLVEGTMTEQTVGNAANTVLYPSNYSRKGYGFAGWSTTYDYSDPNGFYGPNESIALPNNVSDEGLSLYAYWVKPHGIMQNWTCPDNTTMPVGSVTALTDLRDNETYAVAKLVDGKCWMIENLRLNNTSSDNSKGLLAQGYNENFVGLATPEGAALFTATATANSLYSTDGSTEITIAGNMPGYRIPRYSNQNTASRPSGSTGIEMDSYGYGNYYSFAAAIADTGDYTVNNTSVTATSLCPAGWRIPIGGDKNNEANNDYWALIVDGQNGGVKPSNYDSNSQPYYDGGTPGINASRALRAFPNNYVYNGSIYNNIDHGQGTYINNWTATVAGTNGHAYDLYVTASAVRPGNRNGNKYVGRAIRCLVEQ